MCLRVIFVRFNQYGDLGEATHEEKERIGAFECGFDDAEILVETFSSTGATRGATYGAADTETYGAADTEMSLLPQCSLHGESLAGSQLHRPQLHRPHSVPMPKPPHISPLLAAVVDVNGHFALAALCSDGGALFNTTDGSYVAFPGGEAVAVALKVLSLSHESVDS